MFDWVDSINRFKTPEHYTYKLIETLLPKANLNFEEKAEKLIRSILSTETKIKEKSRINELAKAKLEEDYKKLELEIE